MRQDQNHSSADNVNTCEQCRRLVLDHAWTQAQRTEVARLLDHARTCEECRAATGGFDQIAALLAPEEVPATSKKWIGGAVGRMQSNHSRGERWMPVLRLAAAACFAVAIAVVGYRLGRRDVPATLAGVPAPVVSAIQSEISSVDLNNRVSAFEQVNKAFDNRAGWLLVSDNDSDVGLDAAPSAGRNVLLVRLTVTRQNLSGQSRSVVSSADLAILPGRTAKLSLPFPHGRVLTYDISVGTGDPTQLAIFADLRPAQGSNHLVKAAEQKPLAALATELDLRAGAASPAGSFVTGTDGYELTVGFSRAKLPPEGSQ